MFSTMPTRTLLFAVLLSTVLLVVAKPVHAAKCSNATFLGNYGFLVTGTALLNPIAIVGQISADGSGIITGMETISNNGAITNSASVTGTYTIRANCTGTAAITPRGGATTNYNVVVAGGKVQLLGADGNTVESGFALPQDTDTCSRSKVKGQYGLDESGFLVGNGPLAFGGQITLHAGGTITGTRSGSANGTISSGDVISGAYKVGSNCIGGGILFINQEPPAGFNLVVVNGGRGLFFIQTNDNTVVSGSLER